MLYFPGPKYLIQTRRALPSGSQHRVQDPLRGPKINLRGPKMNRTDFCFTELC